MPQQEDKENFCNSVRAEVKAAGILDSTANCWSFFIEKVRLPGLRVLIDSSARKQI